MEKKITKIDRFNELKGIAEVAQNADLMDFINHEIELLQKKSANKKQSKAAAENETLKPIVLDVLATFENGAQANEVLNASDKFNGMSNQKISSLLNSLVTDGKATKATVKGKSIFSAVVTVDTDTDED